MNKLISTGQNESIWNESWGLLTPKDEIQMWDYYGGRQWISKYVPRFGKTIEAGCGLGRYNFYFSRMGIDIEGIDFSKPTIEYLNDWKVKHGFNVTFKRGNVTELPYKNECFRGYISLGVIEHFIDGPQKPLAEAFRVLEPGGIAIITTPSISWSVLRRRFKSGIKKIIKKVIHYQKSPLNFFQYEYRPSTLKKYVEKSGLLVTAYDSADLLYTFTEAGNFSGENIKKGSFGYWFSNTFENTFLRKIGAQSITISVKLSDEMYCFLCGEINSVPESLKKYSIPLCNECQKNDLSKYYERGVIPRFASSYIINPPIEAPHKEICEFSGEEYYTDEIFEDYGFTKKISPKMLRKAEINIKLCNECIQPIWRNRQNER